MDSNTLKTLAESLVSHKVIAPETQDGKSSLVFFLQDLTEEVGKKGQKIVTAAVISKRSVNSVLEIVREITDAESNLEALSEIKGTKLVSLTDKKINGYGAWLEGREEMDTPEDRQEVTRYILGVISNTIDAMEKTVSTADPLAEAKRIFAKSNPVSKLDYSNPAAVFATWEKNELDRINRIMEKSASLDSETLESFVNEKIAANGTDEDGYVNLRGKKTAKAE